MKKIKKYYRIEFQLTSPLSVGSGEDIQTDRDILKDSRGIPYIPGTALAGVYRRLFIDEIATCYFGPELTKEKIQDSSKEGENLLTDSDIITYDAYVKDPKKICVTKRDMAALDEYKAPVKGSKFDFQILEPGGVFVTYIEQNIDDKYGRPVIDEIARAWMAGDITIGGKTSRGYGHTQGISVKTALFHLDCATELDRWLSFEMYDGEDSNWITPKSINEYPLYLAKNDRCTIRLHLKQKGGISIRNYTTEPEEPDYRQLTSARLQDEPGNTGFVGENEGTPVIPGTAWAGAFRAQMGRLDPEFRKGKKAAELFFGKAKAKSEDSRKSRVSFSESRITGGKWVLTTRTAIDRFTGGALSGALYTEKTYCSGSTVLTITCDFGGRDSVNKKERKKFARVLAAAILDLHNGYLSVGGLTAVGRGLFEVERISVNDRVDLSTEKDQGKFYDALVQAVAGEEEQ